MLIYLYGYNARRIKKAWPADLLKMHICSFRSSVVFIYYVWRAFALCAVRLCVCVYVRVCVWCVLAMVHWRNNSTCISEENIKPLKIY